MIRYLLNLRDERQMRGVKIVPMQKQWLAIGIGIGIGIGNGEKKY
jgi:hypothetical protein